MALLSWFSRKQTDAAGHTSDAAPARERANQLRLSGNAQLAAGALHEALACYQQAVGLDPENADTHVNLGFVLQQLSRFAEAQAALETASRLDDTNADCHYMLGELAERQQDFDKAASHFLRAFALKPDFELACREACRLLFLAGRIEECRSTIEAGLALHRSNADLHFYQGNLMLAEKHSAAALASYQVALSLGADHAALHCYTGRLLQTRGDIQAARTHLRRAIELDPGIAEAHHGLGIINYYLGHFEQSIADQQAAIALDPALLHAHTCLLFSLSFAPNCSPQQYLAQARVFAAAAQRAATPPLPPLPARAPSAASRPLRVGWVSGDFRFHPSASFLEGVLSHLAKVPLTLIAFSNNPSNDATTVRLQALMAEWHDIWGMGDADAAALIRSRDIDVLIDLAGHTSYTRLPIFAWRPAPVQASFMGYFASSGMTEIDYFLADRCSVPEENASHFSERIWYLPETRLCMTVPPCGDVPVSKPPVETNGFVTFGSYQALGKINDAVLGAWARIMAQLPHSRLRMQVRNIELPGVRDGLIDRLRQAGIAPDRVSLFGSMPLQAYLASHAEVDLILDTFPYPGGATTADALWMGVPTVTVNGETLLARQGACMLSCVGLPDWVAHSLDDYVALAVRKSQDTQSLAQLRGQLRAQALQSPLFDSARFAKHFAAALQTMHATSWQGTVR